MHEVTGYKILIDLQHTLHKLKYIKWSTDIHITTIVTDINKEIVKLEVKKKKKDWEKKKDLQMDIMKKY